MSGACGIMGMTRDAYRFWWANLKERDHLEDLGVELKIILKCIFKVGWGTDWTDRLTEGTGGLL